MKYLLCIILLIHTPKQQSFSIPLPPEKPYTKTLKDYCLDISLKLDKLGYLSVSPQKFSNFIYQVAKFESGHNLSIKGKDNAGSYGLWQMTSKTRKRLGVKKEGLEHQAEAYFKFLRNVGVKLKQVKSSVDLHCINFAPCRPINGVLSKVSNPQLEALDFNKDSVITREDFKLFHQSKF